MSYLIPDKEEILEQLLRAVVEGRSLEEVSQILYKILRDLLPLDRMGIVFLSNDGEQFVSKINISEMPLKIKDGFHSAAENTTLLDIMKSGTARIINDLPEYLTGKPSSKSTQLMILEGVRSNLSLPLVINGIPGGILFLASTEVGSYGPGHVEILKHISPAISISLEKALFREEKEQSISLSNGITTENHSKTWRDWEKHILINVLTECGGRIYGHGGAAEKLDLPPTTLQGKLKKLGLTRESALKMKII